MTFLYQLMMIHVLTFPAKTKVLLPVCLSLSSILIIIQTSLQLHTLSSLLACPPSPSTCWPHWFGLYTTNKPQKGLLLTATLPDLAVLLTCGLYALCERLRNQLAPSCEGTIVRSIRGVPSAVRRAYTQTVCVHNMTVCVHNMTLLFCVGSLQADIMQRCLPFHSFFVTAVCTQLSCSVGSYSFCRALE